VKQVLSVSERAELRPLSPPIADRILPAAASATLVVVLAFHSGGYFATEWGLIALALLLAAVAGLLLASSVTVGRARAVLPLSLFGLALWQLLSILWSTGAGVPVSEAERTLVYLAAACALLVCVTPARVEPLLVGLVVGTTVVAVYSLGTRLAPGTLGGAYDPSSGYQLAEPIGYANALGLLLVFGITLAAAIALHSRRSLAIAAGAALVPLLTALYFTFSRGALAALALALASLVALERDRVRAAGMLGVLLAAPALGVLLASRSAALTKPGATLQTAQMQGHRLAWQLLALCLVAAGATAGARWRELRVSGRSRRTVGLVACLAVLGLAAAGLVAAGGPASIATRVRHAFEAQPTPAERGSERRLLSVRGNGRADYWTVAARMVERDPLLGDGAGSFALRWMRERPVANDAQDAHSLYLETLAELGPVGFTLLLVALAAPVAALRRVRSAALGPGAAAAYAAFLLHGTFDWDWEIPLLVLLVLTCGASLLALAPCPCVAALTPVRRAVGVAVAVGLLFCALVAHVGNRAAADAAHALARGNTRSATAGAVRARTWMPWSYEPWQLLAESQLAEGAHAAALASIRHAVALDPGQWSVWYDEALADQGRGGDTALARATELNPLGVRVEFARRQP
jgi:hypothetical protein